MSLNLDMSDIFSWLESGYAFLVGMAPKEVESSVDRIKRHVTFYPSTDDVHFDHLVSAKVLHWKVTVFPF